jgi:K+-sensing histidine kinase KdpD
MQSSQSVTLTIEQSEELNNQLSNMRHDINNHLSLMMAAVELVRRKPEAAERMATTLTEQPAKIGESMKKFSALLENALGIKRG